jgi:type I restriction enzyme S subunit
MKWTSIPISELLVDVRPGFASGEDVEYGTLQVRMNNVTTDGNWDFSKKRRVPCTAKKQDAFAIRSGDVLFNATNSPELVGKSACFDELPEPVVFSNHFLRLRPDSNRLIGRYLARWIQLQFSRRVFQSLCRQWVNQATVSRETLLAMCVPLPPLAEQRRIADVLDRAEALRAQRRSSLAQLDTLTQAVFIEMFGDPGLNSKGWELRSLVESKTEFRIGPFGSLLHKSDYVQGGIPLVNPKHIVGGNIQHSGEESVTPRKASQLHDYQLRAGDVVVARRGEMGRCAIVHKRHEGWLCGTGSFFIRASLHAYVPEYLAALLSSEQMRRHLENVSGGAIMPNLNGNQIRNLRLPLPPITMQKRFASIVESIDAQRKRMFHQLLELDALFASLQHRAFRGEL